MKKLIIFDFDGTVGASLPLLLDVFTQVLVAYDKPAPSTEDIARWRGMDLNTIRQDIGINWYQMYQMIGLTQKKLRDRWGEIPPVPGIHTIWPELQQGAELAILSSNDQTRVTQWFVDHGWDHFMTYHAADRGFFAKSRQLWRLLKQANVQPHEALLVCDEVRDIHAAHTVGMPALAVTWGYQTPERLQVEHPEHMADTVTDILEIVNQL